MTPKERAQLKEAIQKHVRAGRSAHFLYCMAGPERKPVLLLGRTRAAIVSAQAGLRRTAHRKVFLSGQVAVKDDRTGYRFEASERKGRAIAGMQRDLRRVFGKASPRLRRSEVVFVAQTEAPVETEPDPGVLDVGEVLDSDELLAVMEMPAPTPLPVEPEEARSSIRRWLARRGKAIGRGLRKATRATGRFLSRAGTAIKDFFELLGHTRPGLGGLVIHTDLDELMDVVKVVDGLTLDRARSQNRIRVELHPIDGRTVVTAGELAVSSLDIGGLKTGRALLRGVRITIEKDEAGRPVQIITVDRVEAEDVVIAQGGPTTIRSGVLDGLRARLSQTGPPVDGEAPTRAAIHIDRGSLREVVRDEQYLDDLHIKDADLTAEDGVHMAVGEARASGVDVVTETDDIHAGSVRAEGLRIDEHGGHLTTDADHLHAEDASLTLRPSGEEGEGDFDVSRVVETGTARIDEAAVHLRAPVVGPSPVPGLFGVREGTGLTADVAVREGRFVPGETRVTFSEPLDGPGWVGLRGAYLDESGTLKADLSGFFDIGFGGHVNEALGVEGEKLPDLAGVGAALAARLRSPSSPGGDNPLSAFDLERTTASGHLHATPGPIDAGAGMHLDLVDSGDGVDLSADHERIRAGFSRLILDTFALGDGLSTTHADLRGGRAGLGHGAHEGEIDADLEAVDLDGLHFET